MIAYSSGPHNAIKHWLDAKLGCKTPDHAHFIAQVSEAKEDITAACGFSNWTGENGDIELSFAMDKHGASQELMRAIFAFVFSSQNCEHATARIVADNHKSRRLAEKLGFKLEGIQRKAKDGKDLILYGLLREEFRDKYCKVNHGQPA